MDTTKKRNPYLYLIYIGTDRDFYNKGKIALTFQFVRLGITNQTPKHFLLKTSVFGGHISLY